METNILSSLLGICMIYFYQPHKHRGSHLSKAGKVYHINVNGVESDSKGEFFYVRCQKESRVYKSTKDILNWQDVKYNYRELEASTYKKDWVREYI